MKLHLLNAISVQFLEIPLYHQIRTVEQLGYIVFTTDLFSK